jgi:myo-inositol-1(or 4)-monophosphatase
LHGTILVPETHEQRFAAAFADAVRRAGDIALSFYRRGARTSAVISHKAGGSPVTEADYSVDTFLKEALAPLVPEAGWLSEETEDSPARLSRESVFVVDPIDGTRAFMKGHDSWAVAAALVVHGRPRIGVIHAPALEKTYVAAQGGGAFLNNKPIRVSPLAAMHSKAKVAAPAILAERLRQTGVAFALQPRIPSLALRIARVASGELDAGFASENANDWDIAAADLILEEAGGRLSTFDGRKILYNRKETRHGALLAAPLQIHERLNAAARLADQA